MILGIYYLTKENKRNNFIFYDKVTSVKKSYDKGLISLHDLIVIPSCLTEKNVNRLKNQFLFTTLGKLIFNEILPPSFPYYINNLKDYNKEEEYKEPVMELEEIEER
jgi:DNA-directed RNA polymerase subunit beta'